ncbi:GAF domain-containing protein [Cryptosporangium sp. NPDC048952]|uniref:GAF domain-containing protein n=1 Tax=Cryptosporangium sp. NPDC048952 TaxID=3363961 RepID=UPI0037178C09
MLAHIEPAICDRARLEEVESLRWNSRAVFTALDDIAARSATWTETPISAVTLLNRTTQICVGLHGVPDSVDIGERRLHRHAIPVEWAFCAPLVASGRPHVVPDPRRHPDYAEHPFVTRFGLQSYLGVPLISSIGQILGGHCVLSTAPHDSHITDVLALEMGAAKAVAILESTRGFTGW